MSWARGAAKWNVTTFSPSKRNRRMKGAWQLVNLAYRSFRDKLAGLIADANQRLLIRSLFQRYGSAQIEAHIGSVGGRMRASGAFCNCPPIDVSCARTKTSASTGTGTGIGGTGNSTSTSATSRRLASEKLALVMMSYSKGRIASLEGLIRYDGQQ